MKCAVGQLLKFLTATSSVVCLGLSAPVSAALVDVVYSGTVSNGWDYAGVFGAVGSLTGQAYTSHYTFETTGGAWVSNGLENYAYGGYHYGLTSPSINASMTIGTTTISWVGNYSAEIYGADDSVEPGIYSEVSHFAAYLDSVDYTAMQNYSYELSSGYYPLSLTDPFSATLIGFSTGSFVKYTNHWANLEVDATLTPDHVAINTPIPEPESYAMLLAGLGLLGFAARRRK